jgi:hypothetical protein
MNVEIDIRYWEEMAIFIPNTDSFQLIITINSAEIDHLYSSFLDSSRRFYSEKKFKLLNL